MNSRLVRDLVTPYRQTGLVNWFVLSKLRDPRFQSSALALQLGVIPIMKDGFGIGALRYALTPGYIDVEYDAYSDAIVPKDRNKKFTWDLSNVDLAVLEYRLFSLNLDRSPIIDFGSMKGFLVTEKTDDLVVVRGYLNMHFDEFCIGL